MTTTKQDLLDFLEFVSNRIETEITLVAVGGTALTLLDIKESTKDVDFDVPRNSDFKTFTSILKNLDFEEHGIRWIPTTNLNLGAIDLFKNGYIFNIQLLDDYIQKAKPIKKIGKINLKTAHLLDIIITKLGRGDERDFDDIKKIYEKERIDNKELIKRYFHSAESLPDAFSETVRIRLLDLVEIKFQEWKIYDKEIKQLVKKWQL